MPKIKESYVDLDINSNINEKVIHTKTFYKVLLYNNKTSLIKFEPKTGKKHQLRIVAKNLGCPIVGDQKYNLNQTKQRENLKLNAFKLEFDIEDNLFNLTSALFGKSIFCSTIIFFSYFEVAILPFEATKF